MRKCVCCSKMFKRTSDLGYCDRCALDWCDCKNKTLKRILIKKSNRSARTISKLINKKIEKIGSEYINEQGSIFLVANDFGVKLS